MSESLIAGVENVEQRGQCCGSVSCSRYHIITEREREREREVRDGKISARVARRAVPVSAEGVKKALPAPAASPVQAVRW